MGGRLFDWLGSGIAADRPTAADAITNTQPNSAALFFATDTKILSVLDSSTPDWFDIDVVALAAIAFATLSDVDLTGIVDGNSLVWRASDSKVIAGPTPTGLTTEQVQDIIGAMITNGTGMNVSYDDPTGTILFTCNITQYTDELAQDAINALIAAGTQTGLTITYDDALNKLSFTIDDTHINTLANARIAAASVDALNDVDTTTAAPTNGQALLWDSGTSKWKPGNVSSGGGGSTPSIRSSSKGTFSATTVTIPLPAGTIAGDIVIVAGEQGFGPDASAPLPAGWTTFYKTSGSNWCNMIHGAKVITSADITAGSVLMKFSGSYSGAWVAVCINGSTATKLREAGVAVGNSTGNNSVLTQAINGLLSTVSTDLILFFGGSRVNAAVTISNGTNVQSQQNTDASIMVATLPGSGLGFFGVNETMTVAAGNSGISWSLMALR